jgi:hypothetical protein
MAYKGPERRIHKVFVTKNREYHTRENVCVGVRDRSSGSWMKGHLALRRNLCGAIKFTKGGLLPNTGLPKPGESLYFHGGEIDVVTSTLVKVERPKKTTLKLYQLS